MERGALRDTRRRQNAERILTRLLGGLEPGVRVRLWEGSELTFGAPGSPFTLVIRDRKTFRRVFRSTRTRALAEAFVENRVDVEGDLFAALRLAGLIEGRRLRLRDRLAILRALLGV
jgi:hypothetical protein